MGARLRCALRHHIARCCASIVSPPTRSRLDDERAGAVHGGADDRVSGLSCRTGMRLTGDHRLVDAGLEPSHHHAVDGHLLSRAARAGDHPPARARAARRPRCPSASTPPRGLGREIRAGRESPCRCGWRARSSMHLAEKHQRDDHGRRLEVHGDAARGRRGTRPGRSPGEPVVATTLYDVGDAGAEGDEGEHVEVAIDLNDAQPRWKNGQPPQSTTGVARASSMPGERASARPKALKRNSGNHAAHGDDRTAASVSDGAHPEPAVSCRPARGSRARRAAPALTDSSAIPQMGQSAGRISNNLLMHGTGVAGRRDRQRARPPAPAPCRTWGSVRAPWSAPSGARDTCRRSRACLNRAGRAHPRDSSAMRYSCRSLYDPIRGACRFIPGARAEIEPAAGARSSRQRDRVADPQGSRRRAQ